jgi:hypothetical protein
MLKSPWLLLLLGLIGIALLTAFGPAEKSLGGNVRVVYLHGVWVWTALAAFLSSGLVGLVGLVIRREGLHRWSRALGRAGLTFWITYLPISLWAMQTSWNGLFLAEPRWRLALVFSLGGLLLQVGLFLVEDPVWASAANLIYLLALMFALRTTENVMHPPSPILDSDAWRIQVFFFALLGLTLFVCWQLTRLWHRLESESNLSRVADSNS